jgi:hypothetical protein
MKVYGIANPVTEHDMGSHWIVYMIGPTGAYGTGDYPHLFRLRENAEAWLRNGLPVDRLIRKDWKIIELDLEGC